LEVFIEYYGYCLVGCYATYWVVKLNFASIIINIIIIVIYVVIII